MDFFNGTPEDGEPMKYTGQLQRTCGHPVVAGWIVCPKCTIKAKDKRIAELKREVRALRQYANKHCIAMAEQALKGDNDE